MVPVDRIDALPNDMLTTASQWLAACREAYTELQATTNTAMKEEVAQNFEVFKERLIFTWLIKTQVLDKQTTPSEEAIQKAYENNLPEYEVPFSFSMLDLLLQTYEDYVVEKDDTLESIAEKISGDASKADNIRADAVGYPLRRDPNVAFKPLMPGETLRVPMNEENAQKVRERLETILKEIDNGTDFVSLVEKYSESSPNPEDRTRPFNLPQGSQPILPELLEKAKETPIGGVSGIFRTKHGFRVIKIISKTEAHVLTLDEVRDRIIDQLKKAQQVDLFDNLLKTAFDKSSIKVNYEALAQDTISTDTIIASIGEVEMNWDVFSTAFDQGGNRKDKEQVDQRLRGIPIFGKAILKEFIAPQLNDPQSELSQQCEELKIDLQGANYMQTLARQKAQQQVSSEDITTYYEAHKNEARYQSPDKLIIRSIEIKPSAEEAKALNDPVSAQAKFRELEAFMQDKLKNVQSVDAFLEVAKTMNAPLLDSGESLQFDILEPMPFPQLPPSIQPFVQELDAGKWTRPMMVENRIVALLVAERQPGEILSLEQVQPSIKNILLNEITPKIYADIEKTYSQKAGFIFALQ